MNKRKHKRLGASKLKVQNVVSEKRPDQHDANERNIAALKQELLQLDTVNHIEFNETVDPFESAYEESMKLSMATRDAMRDALEAKYARDREAALIKYLAKPELKESLIEECRQKKKKLEEDWATTESLDLATWILENRPINFTPTAQKSEKMISCHGLTIDIDKYLNSKQ